MQIGEATVLLTGAAGLLGRHLTAQVQRSGGNAYRTDRVPMPGPTFAAGLVADVTDLASLNPLAANPAPTVIHLAAQHFIPTCEADPTGTRETNVTGTANVLAMARRMQSTCVTFASTADVYMPSGSPLDETSPLGPPSVYGVTKLAGESLVRQWQSEQEHRCAYILRVFNMVGYGDSVAHLIPSLTGQLLGGAKTVYAGNLDTVRDYVWAGDVAALILRLPVRPGVHVLNVGSGTGHTGLDVLQTLCDLTDRNPAVEQRTELVRAVDRPVLICDASLLRAQFPEFPQRSLAETLALSLTAAHEVPPPDQ